MNLQTIIHVEYECHIKALSDHVGIIVNLRNEYGFRTEYEERLIVNKS